VGRNGTLGGFLSSGVRNIRGGLPPATSTGVDVDAGVGCESGRKTTWKGGLSTPPDSRSTADEPPPVPLRWKVAGPRDARGPDGPASLEREKIKRVRPF